MKPLAHPLDLARGAAATGLVSVLLVLAGCGSAQPTASQPRPAPPPTRSAAATSGQASPSGSAAGLQKVVVAMPQGSLTQLPLFVASDTGLFRKEGLAVTIITSKPQIAEAGLVSGQIDFSTFGSSGLSAAAAGTPVKLVLGGSDTPTQWMYSQSRYTSPAQLAGRPIGTLGLTDLTAQLARAILTKAGVPANQIKILALGGSPNEFAALKADKVGAAMLAPPYDYLAKTAGFRNLVFAGNYEHLLEGGIITSDTDLAHRANVVVRFISAYLQAVHTIATDQATVVPIIARAYGLKPNVAAGVYASTSHTWRSDGSITQQVLTTEMNNWRRATKNSRPVPPDNQLVDFGPLHQAQQQLGLKRLSGGL